MRIWCIFSAADKKTILSHHFQLTKFSFVPTLTANVFCRYSVTDNLTDGQYEHYPKGYLTNCLPQHFILFCQTYKSNIITIHDMNLLTLATEVSKTKGNSSAEFLLSNLDMVFAQDNRSIRKHQNRKMLFTIANLFMTENLD